MNNPLFEIAIIGEKGKTYEIRRFFMVHTAITMHKDAQFTSLALVTYEHPKEMCFFVVELEDGSIWLHQNPVIQKKISRKIVTLSEAEKIMQKWEESLRQPKQKKRKHKIHKSNCVSKVRFTVTDQLGNTVTVCGKYAYEWTININKDGMVIQTSFKSRRKALTELERLTGKKIN
jgi:hypothetical protein